MRNSPRKILTNEIAELYSDSSEILDNPELRAALYKLGYGKLISNAFAKIKEKRSQYFTEKQFVKRTDRLRKRRR